MPSVNAVSVSFIPNKHNRHAWEKKLRNMNGLTGKAVNAINRITDTVGNVCTANIAYYFSGKESSLSVEEARFMLTKSDHIRVPLYNKKRGPFGHFYHHGIYCGDGVVIEFNGRYPSVDQYTIEECSLESFARGRLIEVDNREPSYYSPDEIVARAKSRLGERGYHLVYNNCETFATWCRCGSPLPLSYKKLLSTRQKAAKAA